ncbi:hypothetical protein Pan153_60910 [Gimesia panareensis]|uniref:Type II secretion system protein n=2 Tax=Gimesia panareensis TaxID=2527978 RepID=A0A518FYH5_9PLAN|nr:hypothetical protein Pan153_60910 [Gimesia panareensis]
MHVKNRIYSQVKDTDHNNRRAGITLFEAFVSMILVSATIAIALPAFKAIGLQRKAVDERFQVTTALGNLAERISADNTWQTLSQEGLKKYQTALIDQLGLKDPKVELELVENEGPAVNRQVRIKVSWKNTYDDYVDPVMLTLWFYQMSPVHEKV